jgi:hypothetical protein
MFYGIFFLPFFEIVFNCSSEFQEVSLSMPIEKRQNRAIEERYSAGICIQFEDIDKLTSFPGNKEESLESLAIAY